jgi:hypothetical protein
MEGRRRKMSTRLHKLEINKKHSTKTRHFWVQFGFAKIAGELIGLELRGFFVFWNEPCETLKPTN